MCMGVIIIASYLYERVFNAVNYNTLGRNTRTYIPRARVGLGCAMICRVAGVVFTPPIVVEALGGWSEEAF